MDASHRLIRRSDMVACRLAFIDCKMPGSTDKENYSLIGPGVTQSADQVVNITEPHGFSVGAAAMPPGTVNNLHLHFTAEVFMVHSGIWRFRWGSDGTGGELTGGPGDVVSVPTWIFRGFTNVGAETGWIFTALGGDDTGGIIWHPSILATAAEHGLYLTRDNMLVDTAAGLPAPAAEERLAPLDPAAIESLRRVSPAEMRARVVTADERVWSRHALLDSCLPGHASALAPVIGHGFGQDLAQAPRITNPHGFSLEWLRVEQGQSVGPFRLAERQVLIVFAGGIAVTLDDAAPLAAAQGEVVSVPAGCWRVIAALGEGCAEMAVLTSGDQRKHPEWPRDVVAAAAACGVGVDPAGYLADVRLLPKQRVLF